MPAESPTSDPDPTWGRPLPGTPDGTAWPTPATAEAALEAKLDEVLERLERLLDLLPPKPVLVDMHLGPVTIGRDAAQAVDAERRNGGR